MKQFGEREFWAGCEFSHLYLMFHGWKVVWPFNYQVGEMSCRPCSSMEMSSFLPPKIFSSFAAERTISCFPLSKRLEVRRMIPFGPCGTNRDGDNREWVGVIKILSYVHFLIPWPRVDQLGLLDPSGKSFTILEWALVWSFLHITFLLGHDKSNYMPR